MSLEIFGGSGGLLSIVVRHARAEMLALRLDLGFDPDEHMRVAGMDEIVCTAGGPLWHCVAQAKPALAEILLPRGSGPNANVYTAGSPLYRAYAQKDSAFVKLLEQHGGFLDAVSAGYACQTEAARQLLERPAQEHRARLGMPLGPHPFREPPIVPRRRPGRGRRRSVGGAEGLGREEETR